MKKPGLMLCSISTEFDRPALPLVRSLIFQTIPPAPRSITVAVCISAHPLDVGDVAGTITHTRRKALTASHEIAA
jgi:hypothetical protein